MRKNLRLVQIALLASLFSAEFYQDSDSILNNKRKLSLESQNSLYKLKLFDFL